MAPDQRPEQLDLYTKAGSKKTSPVLNSDGKFYHGNRDKCQRTDFQHAQTYMQVCGHMQWFGGASPKAVVLFMSQPEVTNRTWRRKTFCHL